MNVKLFLLSLWFCLAGCSVLQGKIWYVATTGNDANEGSISKPFRTPAKALEVAVQGDEIQIRQGTYQTPELRVTQSNLTIRSYPGEWAVLQCPINLEDESSCIWYSEPTVTGGLLENLEITGGYYYGVKFETNWDWGLPMNETRGVRNVTIKSCKIHDTGRDCIKITPACANIQILNCEIYNSGVGPSNLPANGGPNAEGIDNVNGDGLVVKNCYIHNISTTGVYVKGGAKDCIIEENLIYGTSEAGILLGFYTDAEFFDRDGSNPLYHECQYSVARNNMVYNTGGAGIGFFAARNCSAYHNTIVTGSGNFHAPLYFSKGSIWINDNLTVEPANLNIEVYNNIVIDQSGTGEEDLTVQIREGALTGTILLDYNIYRKGSGSAQFDDGVSWPAQGFSSWKTTTGYDKHSLEVFPQTDGNLHLVTGSPAIDAGRSSPAQRDYEGRTRTRIPDIGADEFGNGPGLSIPPAQGVIGTGADLSTGLDPQSIPSLTLPVFPNPARTGIFLPSLPSDAIVQVVDLQGHNMAVNLTGQYLDCSQWSAGTYWLLVTTASTVFTSKMIIQ